MKIGDYFLLIYDNSPRKSEHVGLNRITFEISSDTPFSFEYKLIARCINELVCTGTKFDTYDAALKGGAKLGLFRIRSLDGLKVDNTNIKYDYDFDGTIGRVDANVEHVLFNPLSPSIELVYNITDNWSDPFNRMCDCSISNLKIFFDQCVRYDIVNTITMVDDKPRRVTLWDKIKSLFK